MINKNIMVAGYRGEIGSFILQGLLKTMPKALNIFCSDINETEEEVRERIEKSDVIFICVPMNITVDWIVKYKELLKGKVLFEQCSLKEDICNDERIKGLDIRSMHILFRPSQTPNLEDRKLGLFEGQFDKLSAKEMADITQSEVVWYENVKEHDKEMAIQQALVHRTLLVLGKILGKCNGSTYVSKKVIELSDRIKQGDKKLYGAIQDNKCLPEKLEEFRGELDKFKIDKYMENKIN